MTVIKELAKVNDKTVILHFRISGRAEKFHEIQLVP
jgi:hypothetical protein